ncbi:MAG TPA: universal stress protein [Acidimicrobiales bacterium]|nr:universal stress protein [Acidimicrobiales bacterium]
MKEGPILVGVDGPPESREALAWAADLARATGASVLAVHAVGLLEKLGPEGSSAAEQEGAGVVVVGSRGSGRAARGGLGSTSSRLAMSCPVPVVIVPGAQVER